jgi:NAD(P)-dependent dehydrogenase (short-subunit alcohol dehydrogenase family)
MPAVHCSRSGRELPAAGTAFFAEYFRGGVTAAGRREKCRSGADRSGASIGKDRIMDKERKVAIVTGASQGIGAALVDAYLERGYRVVAVSRSIKPSADPDVLTIAGDIGDPATGRRAVDEGLARFGRIDTLVNNAGIFVAEPFTRYTAGQYAEVMSTNVNGFFFITQPAIEAMEKQGSGHVVSITTALVDHPSAKVPSVLASLSKGGIAAASKSLAIEYATRGIRVNAVSPGVIKTPMHPAETHEFLSALHPVGRMGEIEDVVGAVLFLETAPFVTGEVLHVDGGQSAGF